MQKCNQHNKTATGNCVWCGRALCNACVGKVVRNKLYCSKCGVELNPVIKRMQFNQMRQEKQKEEEKQKKNFFDFDSIVQK